VFRVLLVCTGNICRSPIAHGLLTERSKRLLGGVIEVRSSGTWGLGGSPATTEGIAAAADLGIDIAGHRASRFTARLARWADLVVTMTTEQEAEVREEAAEAAAKTFTLKELVSILGALPPAVGEPTREALLRRVDEASRARAAGRIRPPADIDVSDPLGLSSSAYRAVARELAGLIDDLVRGLAGDRESAFAGEG
jgi:protein-tyrosine phosphatase